MSAYKNKILPLKPVNDAVEEAKYILELERSGRITGLRTRWSKVNYVALKYFRFGKVIMLAGGSGSGKSAILNMIEDDFTNPELNPTFLLQYNELTQSFDKEIIENKVHILAFKYEMTAADEILRTLSGRVGKSYSYLLSSEDIGTDIPNQERTEPVYNKISDEEYFKYEKVLNTLANRPISYIENAGNLEQLYNTCVEWKKGNPDKQLVVTIDHSLLSKKLNEKDDMELISNTAHTAINLKKNLNALVIIVNQLNGEIEKPIRRDNPSLHYPVKGDIHLGNQIYWACDDVLIFHRPEKLHIKVYGQGNAAVLTKNIIHLSWDKSRKGFGGNIWFREDFKRGNIIQTNFKELGRPTQS